MRKSSPLFAVAATAFGLTITGASAQQPDEPKVSAPVKQSVENAPTDAANSPKTDQAETEMPGRLHRVDELVGAKIQNAQGEDLGEVEELVLDVNSGDIRYAVVSYGGLGDLGDKLFAVPLKAMRFRHDKDKEPFFVVDIDQQRLENATGFDEDDWPNFADQSFAAAANKTYGIDTPPQDSADKAALYKLSTFEGVNVRGKDNAEIGEVEWILIDAMQAKVSDLALDLEDEFEAEANDDVAVLVPMDRFQLKTQDDDTFLMVNADLEKIRTAPTLTEEQLDDPTKHHSLREKVKTHFGAK